MRAVILLALANSTASHFLPQTSVFKRKNWRKMYVHLGQRPSFEIKTFFFLSNLFLHNLLNEVMTKDHISSNTISAWFLGCSQERGSTALYRGVPHTKFYINIIYKLLYIKTLKQTIKSLNKAEWWMIINTKSVFWYISINSCFEFETFSFLSNPCMCRKSGVSTHQ